MNIPATLELVRSIKLDIKLDIEHNIKDYQFTRVFKDLQEAVLALMKCEHGLKGAEKHKKELE